MSRTVALSSLALVAGLGNAHAGSQPSTLGVVDARYTSALCNNGARATFNYVLSTDTSAAGGDYRKKWLVVLSGGGGCDDYAECAGRWAEDPRGPDLDDGPGDHFNMVPDLRPRDFDEHGILDFDGHPASVGGAVVGATANPFRGTSGTDGFNRVWINYCSSDGWGGTGTQVAVDPLDFPAMAFDPTRPALTRLHFGGAAIVDAVIDEILRGDLGGVDFIPDAVEGEIVLAGSSAGGGGTIRNLDTVAAAAPGVLVWGIPDAATAVGPLPSPSGDEGRAAADFYTSGAPDLVRNDDDCVGNGTNRCYAVGSVVVQSEIATPYFVVQQAFDQQIHGPLQDGLADLIRTNLATIQLQWPALYAFATGAYGSPEAAAEAYIRSTITRAAPSIGTARGNPAGLFIPNYATGWHQLLANSARFYTSPTRLWSDPGQPRLGGIYTGTNVSIPSALANFRACALALHTSGDSAAYATCVSTIGAATANARVINASAP